MICEMQLLILQFMHCKENELCIDVYHKQSLWKKMSWLQLQHVQCDFWQHGTLLWYEKYY